MAKRGAQPRRAPKVAPKRGRGVPSAGASRTETLSPPSREPRADDTHQRLLMTAGEVFARRGFREATVREISALAGANLAAVNYHFGDKKGLYSAVIACGLTSGEAFPPAVIAAGVTGEEKLRQYCRAFVRKILDHRKPEWHSKLMAREMAEPTGALDEIVEMMIRPHWVRLSGIVSEILGGAATAELVRVATRSITAQMVFFVHARPVLERLFPGEPWSPESIDQRGDDVAAFSLAALETLRRSGGTR